MRFIVSRMIKSLHNIYAVLDFLCRYKWKRNGIDFNPSGNNDRVVQLPNSWTIVITKPEDKDEGISSAGSSASRSTCEKPS